MSRLVIVTMAAALLAAASISMAARSGRRPAPPTTQGPFVGTLRGGMMGIGGETTGWVLQRGPGAGTLDVDVKAVAEQARALDGKRVTITGQVITRQYVERGPTPILVAEKIVETPESPKK